MADGRPSERGILEIADDSGNVVSGPNRLRLGPGLTLATNAADPSIVIDVSGIISGGASSLASVSALRTVLLPANSSMYVTQGYYARGDGGGAIYYWDSSDNTDDDGVLHFKTSFHANGRMRPLVINGDLMFSSAQCGPRLVDVGTIVKSFDPTGLVAVGDELYRVTCILRDAGYSGISFSPGRYKFNGSERIGTSANPHVPFRITGAGATWFGLESSPGSPGVLIAPDGPGTVFELLSLPYNSRNWTQTLTGGDRQFNGIADITGLSAGDTCVFRMGAEDTDYGGIWKCYAIGKIEVLTPTTGTAGNITSTVICPETPPDAPLNPTRLKNKHDLIKLTRFQDDTVIDGITMEDIQLGGWFHRGLKIDCTWSHCKTFAFNGLTGIDTELSIRVEQAVGTTVFPSNIVTLAQHYGTHIKKLVIDNIVTASGAVLNAVTEESSCRGTRIDYMDVCYNTDLAFGGTCIIAGQTPKQNQAISVGHLIVTRGGAGGGCNIGGGVKINVLDIKSSVNTQALPSTVDLLVYLGKYYRPGRAGEYVLPIPATPGTYSIHFPLKGITSNLRILPSTLTGVTSMKAVGNDNLGLTIPVDTSGMSTSAWNEIVDASNIGVSRPNHDGYNQLSIVVTIDGTYPGGYMLFRHSAFESVLFDETTANVDTTVSDCVVSSGAPSASASYVGQKCFDRTNGNFYDAVAIGSGSSDWKIRGGTLGALVAANNLSDVANAGTARTNLGLAIGTNVQAHDSDLDSIAALSTTSFGRSLLTLADALALTNQLQNSGGSAGSLRAEVLIDTVDLPALSTNWTTVTFTGDSYRKLIIEMSLVGSATSSMRMVVNSDTGTNYQDQAWESNGSAISIVKANGGVNGYARVAATDNRNKIRIEMDSVRDGNNRSGFVKNLAGGNSDWANNIAGEGWFAWTDTTNEITSLTFTIASGTFAGRIIVKGVKV